MSPHYRVCQQTNAAHCKHFLNVGQTMRLGISTIQSCSDLFPVRDVMYNSPDTKVLTTYPQDAES